MELQSTYVFIDTSVYERNKFFFHKYSLEYLLSLFAEEHLTLITNPILEQEVISHIKANLIEAYKKLKKEKSHYAILEVTDFFSFGDVFNNSIKIEDVIEEKIRNFKDYLLEANAISVPVNSVSIDKIFEEYFSQTRAFYKKKNEFPDAFMLHATEKFALKKGISVYVISDDPDQIEYCKTTSALLPVEDLKIFIDSANRTLDKYSDNLTLAKEVVIKNESYLNDLAEKLIIDSEVESNVSWDVEVTIDSIINIEMTDISIQDFDDDSTTVLINLSCDIESYHTYMDESDSVWSSEDHEYVLKSYYTDQYSHTLDIPLIVEINHPDHIPSTARIEEAFIEGIIEFRKDDGQLQMQSYSSWGDNESL